MVAIYNISNKLQYHTVYRYDTNYIRFTIFVPIFFGPLRLGEKVFGLMFIVSSFEVVQTNRFWDHEN